MTYDAIVIGGGVNGLVAASYLAKGGKRVVVCERRESLGGVSVTEEFHPGFRANTAVDDAGWVPERVMRDLALARHGYTPAFAASGLTFPVDDGTAVSLPANVGEAASILHRLSPADAARWPAFCAMVERLSGFLAVLYEAPAPDVHARSMSDILTMMSLGRRVRGLGKRGMIDLLRTIPMPVSDLLDEWFEHPGLKAALSLLGVLNVQHGPYSGGTSLVFLHRHVGLPEGHIGGRRMTPGGVGRLPLALAAAARAAGVDVLTRSEVAEIVVERDRVAGVRLSRGDVLSAATIVSSADPRRTFGTMIDPGWFDPGMLNAIDNIRMRGPATRLHLALSELPAFSSGGSQWPVEALRGWIALPRSVEEVERAYDAAKHGGIAAQPAILATIPTLDDPSLAPTGAHVLSVQSQYTAYAPDGGWTEAVRAAMSNAVLDGLTRVAPRIRDIVQHVQVLAPPDLEARFGVTEGSVLHGELALDQYLFMRPIPECARHATPLEGLWLCGSGTHPGAGTAGASGVLAARAILSNRRNA
ncbi:MAG: hypothetical protein MNPFHGCM_03219 [Gemmatimonadaceae bacterium]|nr:hypothetical protein [Gemmatimonadaceae bacterium]